MWKSFKSYINDHIHIGKQGVLVAWNGETCDMGWRYRLTHRPNTKITFPKQIRYFMNPLEIIRRHYGCSFNPKKLNLQSLSLGSVCRFIHKSDLIGSYNSLVDAKSQTDVVLHQYFKGCWEKTTFNEFRV